MFSFGRFDIAMVLVCTYPLTVSRLLRWHFTQARQLILSQGRIRCQDALIATVKSKPCGPLLPVEPLNKFWSSTLHCRLGPRIAPVASKCSLTNLLLALKEMRRHKPYARWNEARGRWFLSHCCVIASQKWHTPSEFPDFLLSLQSIVNCNCSSGSRQPSLNLWIEL